MSKYVPIYSCAFLSDKDIVISLVYGEAYKVHPEQIEKIVALLLDIRANGDLDKIAEAGDLTNSITKDSDNLDEIIDKLTKLKG